MTAQTSNRITVQNPFATGNFDAVANLKEMLALARQAKEAFPARRAMWERKEQSVLLELAALGHPESVH